MANQTKLESMRWVKFYASNNMKPIDCARFNLEWLTPTQ